MVASQLASGSGRRWSSEIETSGNSRPARVGLRQVLEVEPAVQGGDGPAGERPRRTGNGPGRRGSGGRRTRAAAGAPRAASTRWAARSDFSGRGIEADRLVAHGHQRRLGPRLGAGEQRHVVAELDQGVGEMGDDPLGAAVEARRDGLVERCDLGDLHELPRWHRRSDALPVDPGPGPAPGIGHRVALQRLLQLLGIDQDDLAGAGAMARHGKPDEGGEPAVGEERQALDLLLLDVDVGRCLAGRRSQALQGERVPEGDLHGRAPRHAWLPHKRRDQLKVGH